MLSNGLIASLALCVCMCIPMSEKASQSVSQPVSQCLCNLYNSPSTWDLSVRLFSFRFAIYGFSIACTIMPVMSDTVLRRFLRLDLDVSMVRTLYSAVDAPGLLATVGSRFSPRRIINAALLLASSTSRTLRLSSKRLLASKTASRISRWARYRARFTTSGVLESSAMTGAICFIDLFGRNAVIRFGVSDSCSSPSGSSGKNSDLLCSRDLERRR